jgi:Fumarylacetoacetate (FAA) hydrolase family
LQGVEAVARPVRYQNLICNTDENPAKELDEVEALMPRTNGLIVASSLPSGEAGFYRRIIKGGTKVVLIDRRLEGLRCPAVTTSAGWLGYTLISDVSARDLQFGDGQWVRGKGLDGFVPLGPFIITRDEIADVHALKIEGRLNGEIMQSSNTGKMIFKVPYLI